MPFDAAIRFIDVGDEQAVLLARRALTARLDREEPRHAGADRRDVDLVVDHDERGGAEPGADGLEPFPARGRVELVGGNDRGGRALEHGFDRAVGAGAAAERLDDFAQRRSHRELADAGVRNAAAHGREERSRRLVGADLAEPVGALGERDGHVRERLHVVDERGRRFGLAARSGHLDVRRQAGAGREVAGRLDHLVDAAPVRRCDARERVAAVDRFEQRGLFAEQVLGRSFDEVDLDTGREIRCLHFGDRGAYACDVARRGSLHADDHLVGADRVRGDQRAFEHAVRVAVEQLAVLERSGLTFGRVHDDGRQLERRSSSRRRCATSRRSGNRRHPGRECRPR